MCDPELCSVYNNRHRRRSVADDISFQQSVESGRPTGGYVFYKYYFRNFVNTIRVLSDSKRPPMMNARRKSVHSGKLIGSGQVSNELHLLLWTVNSPHTCLFNVNWKDYRYYLVWIIHQHRKLVGSINRRWILCIPWKLHRYLMFESHDCSS